MQLIKYKLLLYLEMNFSLIFLQDLHSLGCFVSFLLVLVCHCCFIDCNLRHNNPNSVADADLLLLIPVLICFSFLCFIGIQCICVLTAVHRQSTFVGFCKQTERWKTLWDFIFSVSIIYKLQSGFVLLSQECHI